MSIARFLVRGLFDRSVQTKATVTINRSNNVLAVRPARSRHTYEMPLDTVAEIVVRRHVVADANAAIAAKKARRR